MKSKDGGAAERIAVAISVAGRDPTPPGRLPPTDPIAGTGKLAPPIPGQGDSTIETVSPSRLEKKRSEIGGDDAACGLETVCPIQIIVDFQSTFMELVIWTLIPTHRKMLCPVRLQLFQYHQIEKVQRWFGPTVVHKAVFIGSTRVSRTL